MNEFDFVSDVHKAEALQKLRERVASGEDPAVITGIRDAYYLGQVMQGYGAMSYRLYDKIMECSKADGILCR